MLLNMNKGIGALFIFMLGIAFIASTSFAGENEWLKFDAGLAKAKKENKSIVVDFYTDWCHWCKVMDKETFKNADVAKKLQERFVTVRVNAEAQNEQVTFQNQKMSNVQLTRSFGVTGYPSIAFMDASGKPITIVPGFVKPDVFIHILDFIDLKCYKKDVSFEQFMEKGGCGKKKS